MNQKIIFSLLGLILIVFVVYNIREHSVTKKTGNAKHLPAGASLPSFKLKEITGKAGERYITSGPLKGKVLFINFWASWCRPCVEEMGSIQRLYKKMAKDKDFQMISIVYREDPAASLRFIKEQRYSFPVYVDTTGELHAQFGVTGVPETYIFNKKGILAYVKLGPAHWDSPEIVNAIGALLKN